MVIEAIVGQTINFEDTSSGLNLTGVTYEWDFGDGSPLSTIKDTSHSYNTKGLYTITHSVKNSCNISPSICSTQQVSVIYPICRWLADNGGVYPMPIANVSTLKSAYLGYTTLGFTVSISHVSGAKSYYLGIPSSGNSLTGCDF